MVVKINPNGSGIVEIARLCGCAPCQILAVNNVKSESELDLMHEIFVPIIFEKLVC